MFAFKIFLLLLSLSTTLSHPYGASRSDTKGGFINLGGGLELDGSGHDAKSKGVPEVGAHVKANVDIAGVHLGYDEGVDLGGSKGIALTKQVDVGGHKVGVEKNDINLGKKVSGSDQGLDGHGREEVLLETGSSQTTQSKSHHSTGLLDIGGVFGSDHKVAGKDHEAGVHQTNQLDGHGTSSGGKDGDLHKIVDGIFAIGQQGHGKGGEDIHRGTTSVSGTSSIFETHTGSDLDQVSHTHTHGTGTSGDNLRRTSEGNNRGILGSQSNSGGQQIEYEEVTSSQQHLPQGQRTHASGSYGGSSSHGWSTSEQHHSHQTSGSSRDGNVLFGNRPFFDDHSAEDSEVIGFAGSHTSNSHRHDHGHGFSGHDQRGFGDHSSGTHGLSVDHNGGGSVGTDHSSGGYVHRISDGIDSHRTHGGYGSGHSSVVESSQSSGGYVHRISDGIDINRNHRGGYGSGQSGHNSGIEEGFGFANSHRTGGESTSGYGHGTGHVSRVVENFGSTTGTGSHSHDLGGHVVLGGGFGTGGGSGTGSGYGTGAEDRGTGIGLGLGIGIKGGHDTHSGYGTKSHSGGYGA